MSKFLVRPSGPLSGTVTISGAKNAALPILAACLLTREECVVKSVPPLSDVFVLLKILENLGAAVSYRELREEVHIQAGRLRRCQVEDALAGQLRASFLVAGPLLARTGRAKVPLPGGCAIGGRPVDLHLKGFAALGAKVRQSAGVVDLRGRKLTGTEVYLDFPSVGATENLLMAAALAEGTTVLQNAATEPEVCDLAVFLGKMGVKIKGAGTDTVQVTGTKTLKGVRHKVIPDRIEAGTFMTAAAITKGDVTLKNVIPEHLRPMLAKLEEAGVECTGTEDGLRVRVPGKLSPISVKTMPYPGFPTDLQAPLMSLMTMIPGTSTVTETVFENRFGQVGEMRRLGAEITTESRTAVVEGGHKLTGASVRATDLRAGAALLLSALAAEGSTEISDIYHIDRGYAHIERKLRELGADVERVEEDEKKPPEGGTRT